MNGINLLKGEHNKRTMIMNVFEFYFMMLHNLCVFINMRLKRNLKKSFMY